MPHSFGRPDIPIRTLAVTTADLGRDRLPHSMARLMAGGTAPALVVGFVSPHIDFAPVAETIRSALPDGTPLVLVSTAGELCSCRAGGLYNPTGECWDNIVLQAFGRDLIEEVSVHRVPLHSEDIRADTIALDHEQRVGAIRRELETIDPPFVLDSHDTLAITFIDGLSASESCFMEAIYATGKFPILFVGGSSGGKLDFQRTWIWDGERVLENHAVVVFVKLARGKRYGILKSQNFRKTAVSFTILDADPARRTVTNVIDPRTLEILGFIDALCRSLDCGREELAGKLASHTFAIELDGELFVRSVSKIDLEVGKVAFYCDVNPGDELILVEATDFIEQTVSDFAAFLDGKPRPIGGILNDCVLRRLNNAARLDDLDLFADLPVAGFSTFGELLGININQTLSAVFFFAEERPGTFHDRYVDAFPVHYARFQNYFNQVRHNRLSMLNRLRQRLIQNLIAHSNPSAALYGTVEQITAYADRVATDEPGSLASTVVELLGAVRRAREEREAVTEELWHREQELRLAEERRAAAETRIELEAQLLQARKLESLGCLAGGLAHEINNMLQPIIGLTELAMDDIPAESCAYTNLARVIEAAQRAQRITSQVLAFSRTDRGVLRCLSLTDAVRNAMEMVNVLVSRSVAIVWRIAAEEIFVHADETQVTQVLINLVRNAADAIADGGEVEVGLDKVWLDAGTQGALPRPAGWYAVLGVRDTGCGMDAPTRERIFDPFFTTKSVGQGTGLGLAMVHGMVTDWGGHIAVDSAPGLGTTIRVLLPMLLAEKDAGVGDAAGCRALSAEGLETVFRA